MYGIDSDTNELLRYTFDNDEYVRIGVVRRGGTVIDDVEALGQIPYGDLKGLYGVPTGSNYTDRLVRIDPLDASAYVYPDEVGFEHIIGMISVWDGAAGKWRFMATSKESRDLIWIDAETGLGTKIADLPYEIEGLAQDSDGTLFGVNSDEELYTIDMNTGAVDFKGSFSTYTKVEALEFAFGDFLPPLEISGVPPGWTNKGVLFAFSDDTDRLLVMSPYNANVIEYHCAFQTIDCEGLVFTTVRRETFGIAINPVD